MITLLPTFHETIVLPKSAQGVYELLTKATSNKPFIQSDEESIAFNGWVQEQRFRLSLRVHRANHYLPLVIGRIESSSTGSILLIDYFLFPTTRLLLTLWCTLITLGAVFASYQARNITFLLGGAAIIILILFIAWSNFRLQLNPTRKTIHQLLS